MVPHTSSGRTLTILFLLAALLLAARPAHGGWSAEPVQVHATSAECPQVAACGDGAYGAVIVWQENSAGTSGVLRASRLLATGDLDPAWPAPATVCATIATRSALGAVTDGEGGAYLWWISGSSLYLSRLTSAGEIAPGWPAGGRLVGSLVNPNADPTVLADASGGVWVAWLQSAVVNLSTVPQLRVTHLGPGNTGVAGCPAAGRAIGTPDEGVELGYTASAGLAPGGGLWAAWGTIVMDPELGPLPGEWRLTRLLASALPASGWTMRGVGQGAFGGDQLLLNSPKLVSDMTLVGVATDGADGAYVVRGEPGEPFQVGSPLLFRFGSDGSPVAGWPEGGVYVNGWSFDAYPGMPAEASFRAIPDGRGGVWAGRPNVYDHGTTYSLHRFTDAGTSAPANSVGGSIEQLEVAHDGFGGVFVANCVPTGPSGPYQPYATVNARGGPSGAACGEFHSEPVQRWYGDEGLTATEDGGAILAWSQVHERFGIFAMRLGPGGVVTEVPAAAVAPGSRFALRFEPGVGVRARATFEVSGTVRCALHDVTGRLIALERFQVSPGERAWTMAGTRPLPAGLYFANLTGAGAALNTRVVVVR